MKNKTLKQYEEYLNDIEMLEEDFIIGGKMRQYYYQMNMYGTALRKYDPIAFRVGYGDWKR